MADKTIRGRFVWHELMTADSAAAHGFYNKVLGWSSQPAEHDPSYSMFAAATGPLGGTVAQSAGAPGWLHYIGTTDLEATVRQAKELGASVTKEITPTGTGGSYAVLTDPQGASFAVYASSSDLGREKPPKRGEFSWHELATSDPEAALKFYSALFGWENAGQHDMGPMGFYYLFSRNGNQIGGMFSRPPGMPGGPAWLGYVRVKDAQKAVKKVKSAGGTLINGPMEVPGGDWIAQFIDPQGAMFAVHVAKADVEPAGTEAAAAAPAPAQVEKPAAAPKAAPAKSVRKAAKKAARKKAARKKAAVRKKPVARKKPIARKKSAGKRRRVAAKSAKRPARKAAKARKAPKKKQQRSAGKKKASRKAGRKAAKTSRKAKKSK